jgi:hypothetical protein
MGTGRQEDPKYLQGELWDGSRFPVDASSLGEARQACFVRAGEQCRFYRLPAEWSRLMLAYSNGSVLVANMEQGRGVSVRSAKVERVLTLDFEKDVKPLVAQYGGLGVTFEARLDQRSETQAVPLDMVWIESPGDCSGRVWNKNLVEGVRGEIITYCGSRRVVFQQ